MKKINFTTDYIIEQIKKNLPILDVADEFGLKLRRSGRSYLTLCPVHGEKTPSFSLVPSTDSTKDFFHCFGCGASGDQIKLFAILNNMSNGQAISFLAKRFSLSNNTPLPEPLVREYTKNKRERTVEKNFLIAYKQIFYDLCCIRDMINGLASQYQFKELLDPDDLVIKMELLEQDDLLVKYYHENHDELLESLRAGLFEEISFNQKIEVFMKAKGVVTEWENLLQKR